MSLPTWLTETYGVSFVAVEGQTTLVDAMRLLISQDLGLESLLIIRFPDNHYQSMNFDVIDSTALESPVMDLPSKSVTAVIDEETPRLASEIEETLLENPENVIVITRNGHVITVLYNPTASGRTVRSVLQGVYDRLKGIKSDDVMFSSIYPSRVSVGQVCSFFVYAHLPEEMALILADGQSHPAASSSLPPAVKPGTVQRLRRGTVLTAYLESDQQAFKPVVYKQVWQGSWVRFQFDFEPDTRLVDKTVLVKVIVLANGLETAALPECHIHVVAGPSAPGMLIAEPPASLYDKIFISYARENTEIVEQYRLWQQARGDDVFMDVYDIRSGEDWMTRLKEEIEKVTVFQLFWSHAAKASRAVTEEWKHALTVAQKRQQDGRGFIRPVYWHHPLPEPPHELKHLHFKYLPLSSAALTGHPDIEVIEVMKDYLHGEFAIFQQAYTEILKRLSGIEEKQTDTKEMLEAVQSGLVSQAEMQSFVILIQSTIAPLQHNQQQLGQDMQQALSSLRMILDADVGLQHKFELTIPIIPMLLDYKVEGQPQDIQASVKVAFEKLRARIKDLRNRLL